MDDLNAIVARLEKVEKQNRKLKQAGLACLLAGACIVVMGQARPSRTVEAEWFVIKDPQGHVRATLGYSLGAPMLNLYDKAGAIRA